MSDNRLASQTPAGKAHFRRMMRSIAALQKLREIEAELREQANGEQDGYLLSVADRMREAMSAFQ